MFRNVIICIIALCFSFAAGNAVTDFVETSDTGIIPEMPPTDLNIEYEIEWTIRINSTTTALGLTPVCIGTYPAGETLLWVSDAGSSTVTTDNRILIYNLNTRTLVDSFMQPDNSGWGYRDMCFYDGYVYAGYEGYLHKINPLPPYNVVGSYAVSTPAIVRALTDNNLEDSLWTSNFAVPIYKISTQGGTARQVAPAVFNLYGLAYDPQGYMWGYAQNPMSTLIKYTYPNFGSYDSCQITEIINPLGDSAIAGGCEMWRDSFLLILGQAKPLDIVYCLRVYFPPPSQRDVGVNAIISPGDITIPNTPIAPIAKVKNFGTLVQTNIPVSCSIVGAGGVVRYTNTQTIPTLAAGDTIRVNFASWTPTIEEMCTVKMRTNLTNDSNPGNDGMTSTTNVTSTITIEIGTATTGSYLYTMNCNAANSVSDQIYLQSEIGQYGTITSYALYKNSGANVDPITGVRIYMRHVPNEVTETGPWNYEDYTLVYSGDFTNNATVGWMSVTLTTPFLYNNVDNLQVMIVRQAAAFTGYPAYRYTTTTPNYRSRYAYGATLPVSITRTYLRANVQLGMTPAAPPVNDVGVRQIISPPNLQFIGIPIQPSALIQNYGSANQTNFAVHCTISNSSKAVLYTSTRTISLTAGSDTTVNFGSYTATTAESVMVSVRTVLVGDEVPGNDRKVRNTEISPYITIGTATTGSYFYTMNCNAANSVSEGIFLQEEIGCYGEITSFALYKNSGTNVDPINGVVIYMKHTPDATIETGAWDTTGYTRVFQGQFTNNATEGWMDVTLTTPFLYNNADNLRVLIVRQDAAITGYPYYRYTTTTPNYRSRYAYGAAVPTSLTRTYLRANVRMAMTVQTPPANDVGIAAITSPGAHHMINTPMTVTAVLQNYGSAFQTNVPVICSIVGPGGELRHFNTQTQSINAGDTITIAFASWTPTLTEEVTVIVRSMLANDTNPANDRRTTTCEIAFTILSEGFEGTTFPPPGRVVYNNDGGTQQWQRSTTAPRTGLAHASCRYETSTLQNDDWLVTPQLAIPAAGATFKFWYRVSTSSTPIDQLVIRLSTTDNTIPAFTVVLDSFELNNLTYMEKVISLNAYANQNIHLAFVSRGLYAWTIYLDDVRVDGHQVGMAEEMIITMPMVTILNAAKPNPLSRGVTNISFSIGAPTNAALKIYDASGRLVKTLVNAPLEQGMHNYIWNGKDENNRKVAEGVYFYTLKTDDYSQTKKLVLTR